MLYDAKGEDKHDLMDKYADIAEDFTEAFFDARNMEQAGQVWNDVEQKQELIDAIFETPEFYNLYNEHEYDDRWFNQVTEIEGGPVAVVEEVKIVEVEEVEMMEIDDGELSDPDGDFAELGELVQQPT